MPSVFLGGRYPCRSLSVAGADYAECVAGVCKCEYADSGKPGRDCIGHLLRYVGRVCYLLGGERLCARGINGGEYGSRLGVQTQRHTVAVRAQAPGAYHQWMCGNVFVGYPEICAQLSVGFAYAYRPADSRRYCRLYDYDTRIDFVGVKLYVDGRLAICLCGLLYHIYVFLVAHTGYRAVILDANQQASALVIGKSGDAAGYFAGITDDKLKVLMLMLALVNEALYVVAAFCGL